MLVAMGTSTVSALAAVPVPPGPQRLATIGRRLALVAAVTCAWLGVIEPVSANAGPLAAITAIATPAVGQPVTFDASGSTPAGSIVDYRWDLDGSGTFATDTHTSPKVTHAFSAPGPVAVSVRVTDNLGATSTATDNLVVGGGSTGSGGSTGTGGSTGSGGSTSSGGPSSGDGSSGSGSGSDGGGAGAVTPLGPSELALIVPGSRSFFAAITGSPRRRAGTVAAHGLWLNVLADRPARFDLRLVVTAAVARRLHLAPGKRAKGRASKGLVALATATTRLPVAGQRPFDLKLNGAARSALRRLRGRVSLAVTGVATDAAGHKTALRRGFLLAR